MPGQPDAQLRFQADLIDNTSAKLDTLEKKLRAMGADPTQIKMIVKAVDESTPKVKAAQEAINRMPKEHKTHLKVDTSDLHRAEAEVGRFAMRVEKHMAATTHTFKASAEEMKKALMEPMKLMDVLGGAKKPIGSPGTISGRFMGSGEGGGGGGGNLDRAEEWANKDFNARTKLMVPMAGSIPGMNMLYGVGAGAGLLTAVSTLEMTLKKSIDANSQLEQQMAELTEAVKSSGMAQAQMAKITSESNRTTFPRADLAQANIAAQQIHLPVQPGESKYLPQGTMKVAENLAASQGTSASQAMQAIVMASQGYYRALRPYNIVMKNEDFGAGGRFVGKSPLQAIGIATERVSGAEQMQRDTMRGMVQEFKNQWENKVILPLGHFAFQNVRASTASTIGKFESPQFQQKLGEGLDIAQTKLSATWTTLQKGQQYFQMHLLRPLASVASLVGKLGLSVGSAFTSSLLSVGKTFGTGFVQAAQAITNVTGSVGFLSKGLTQVYGTAKALDVLGFHNISRQMLAPLKAIQDMKPGAFLRSLLSLPSVAVKIGAFKIYEGFLSSRTATNDVNRQFRDQHREGVDNLNADLDRQARYLGMNSVALKNLAVDASHTFQKGNRDAPSRPDVAAYLAEASQQVHLATGASASGTEQLAAKQMAAQNNFSRAAVDRFTNAIEGAQAAAKSLHMSFKDAMNAVNQFAVAAQRAGVGGATGAPAVTTLSGIMKQLQNEGKIPSASAGVEGALGAIKNLDPAQMYKFIGGGHLSPDFVVRNNPAAAAEFRKKNTGELSIGEQSATVDRSIAETRRFLGGIAPETLKGKYSIPLPQNVLKPIVPNMDQLLGGTAQQNADNIAKAVSKVYDQVGGLNKRFQEATITQNKYQMQSDTLQASQASLSLETAAYNQKVLVPLQRQMEDMSLTMAKFQLKAVVPLQQAMADLNQAQAENSNKQMNAQWTMDKFTQGLMSGEQAALNQAHALERSNKQVSLMMLQYSQIGAQLGQTTFSKGAKIRIEPLAGISLEYQQQQLQRKQQMQQLEMDLKYGEQHYQVEQAARTKRQREEIPVGERLRNVRQQVPIIDSTFEKTHQLENQQFKLGSAMYRVNRAIAKQTAAMQALQIKQQEATQAPEVRHRQDQEAAIAARAGKIQQQLLAVHTELGNIENAQTLVQQAGDDLMKLFQAIQDNTMPEKFKVISRLLDVAEKTGAGGLTLKLKVEIERKFQGPADAARDATIHPRHQGAHDSVIGYFTHTLTSFLSGGIARDIGQQVTGFLGNPKGLVGTATSTLAALTAAAIGIQTVRVGFNVARYGLGRTIAGVGRRVPGTRVIGGLSAIGEARAQARVDNLDRKITQAQEKGRPQEYIDDLARRRSLSEEVVKRHGRRMTMSDPEYLADKIAPSEKGFLESIKPKSVKEILSEMRKAGLGGAVALLASIPVAMVTANPQAAAGASTAIGRMLVWMKGRAIYSDTYRQMMAKQDASIDFNDRVRRAEEAANKARDTYRLNIAKNTKRAAEAAIHTTQATARAASTTARAVRDVSIKTIDGAHDVRGAVHNLGLGQTKLGEKIGGHVDALNKQGGWIDRLKGFFHDFEGKGVGRFVKAVGGLLAGLGTLFGTLHLGDIGRTISEAWKSLWDKGGGPKPPTGGAAAASRATTGKRDASGKSMSDAAHQKAVESHLKDINSNTATLDPNKVSWRDQKTKSAEFDATKGGDSGGSEAGLFKRVMKRIGKIVGPGADVWFASDVAQGVAKGDMSTMPAAAYGGASAAHAAAQVGLKGFGKMGVKDLLKFGSRRLLGPIGTAMLTQQALQFAGLQVDQMTGGDLDPESRVMNFEQNLGASWKSNKGARPAISNLATQIASVGPTNLHKFTGRNRQELEKLIGFDPTGMGVDGKEGASGLVQYMRKFVHQSLGGDSQIQMSGNLMANDRQEAKIQQDHLQALMNQHKAHWTDVQKGQNDHWTAISALNAINQKSDLQGFESYLAKHTSDHKATNENLIKYAQRYYGDQNTVTNQGYTQIHQTSDKWLKKIQKQINDALKAMGVANPTADSSATDAAGHTKHGTTAADHPTAGSRRNYAHGAHIMRQHLIRGKGDGKGYLAHVGEEGDEMIIPLSPHRRERAKSLLAHAHGLIGGMKHAHHPHFASGGNTGTAAAGFKPGQAYAGLGLGRLDQGVDFSGSGPVRAVLDGTVVRNTIWPGWPGTGGVVYNTPRGAVFVMEHFNASVKVGQHVKAGDILGQALGGYPFIETGWANSAGTGPLTPYNGAKDGTPMPGAYNFLKFIKTGLGSGVFASGGGGAAAMPFTLPAHLAKVPKNLLKMGPGGIAVHKMLSHVQHLIRKQNGGSKAHAAFNLPSVGVGQIPTGSEKAIIGKAAAQYGIPAKYLWGVYGAETNFGHNLSTSGAGAQGPFQFMPGTADSYVPGGRANIQKFGPAAVGAAKYLRELFNSFHSWPSAIGHYNSGPGGSLTNSETAAYIPKVLSYAKSYAGGKKKVNSPMQLALLHEGETVLNAAEANVHDKLQMAGAGKFALGKGDAEQLHKLLKHMEGDHYREIHLMRVALQSLDKKTVQQKIGSDLSAINDDLRRRMNAIRGLPKIGSHKGDLTGGEGEAALISRLTAEMNAYIKAHAGDAEKIVDGYIKAHHLDDEARKAAADLPHAMTELRASLQDIPGVTAAIRQHTIKNIEKLAHNEAQIKAMRLDAKALHMHLSPAQLKQIHHLEQIDKHLRAQIKSVEKHMSPAERKRFEAAEKRVEKDIIAKELPGLMRKLAKAGTPVAREFAMEKWMKEMFKTRHIDPSILAKVTKKSMHETERILGLVNDTVKKQHTAISKMSANQTQAALKHLAYLKSQHGTLNAAQRKQLAELQAHRKELMAHGKWHIAAHAQRKTAATMAGVYHNKRTEHNNARSAANLSAHSTTHGHLAARRSQADAHHGARMTLSGAHHAAHMSTLNNHHAAHLQHLGAVKDEVRQGTKEGISNDNHRAQEHSYKDRRTNAHHHEHMEKLEALNKKDTNVTVINHVSGATISSDVHVGRRSS